MEVEAGSDPRFPDMGRGYSRPGHDSAPHSHSKQGTCLWDAGIAGSTCKHGHRAHGPFNCSTHINPVALKPPVPFISSRALNYSDVCLHDATLGCFHVNIHSGQGVPSHRLRFVDISVTLSNKKGILACLFHTPDMLLTGGLARS